MDMRVMMIGVQRRSGNAKSTGSPYDMCQVLYLEQIKQGRMGAMNVDGVGYEQVGVDCDASLIQECLGAPFPQEAVLQLEVKIGDRGRPVSICTAVALTRQPGDHSTYGDEAAA